MSGEAYRIAKNVRNVITGFRILFITLSFLLESPDCRVVAPFDLTFHVIAIRTYVKPVEKSKNQTLNNPTIVYLYSVESYNFCAQKLNSQYVIRLVDLLCLCLFSLETKVLKCVRCTANQWLIYYNEFYLENF